MPTILFKVDFLEFESNLSQIFIVFDKYLIRNYFKTIVAS